jgi:hypothetical protein
MCRSIKTLFNFDPPATDAEIRAASLQFVRKLSGVSTKPSKMNEEVFDKAVENISIVAKELLDGLTSNGEKKNREVEAERARARSAKRFGKNN